MESNVDLSEKYVKEVSFLLTNLLADEMVLLIKTKSCQWNVDGYNFDDFQNLFQHQCKRVDISIDEIAARIKALDHFSIGTMEDFLKFAQLKESRLEEMRPHEMIRELLNDHRAVLNSLRNTFHEPIKKFNDSATDKLLNVIIERHEKMVWMLNMYLE